MNKIILMGRLTKDVELRYSQSGSAVAKYTLAVNREYKREGEPDADFFNCIAFGKSAEFADKYYKKGQQVLVVGRVKFGSFTGRDGNKVYTTDVEVSEQFFADSKREAQEAAPVSAPAAVDGGGWKSVQAPAEESFAKVEYGEQEDLPF